MCTAQNGGIKNNLNFIILPYKHGGKFKVTTSPELFIGPTGDDTDQTEQEFSWTESLPSGLFQELAITDVKNTDRITNGLL